MLSALRTKVNSTPRKSKIKARENEPSLLDVGSTHNPHHMYDYGGLEEKPLEIIDEKIDSEARRGKCMEEEMIGNHTGEDVVKPPNSAPTQIKKSLRRGSKTRKMTENRKKRSKGTSKGKSMLQSQGESSHEISPYDENGEGTRSTGGVIRGAGESSQEVHSKSIACDKIKHHSDVLTKKIAKRESVASIIGLENGSTKVDKVDRIGEGISQHFAISAQSQVCTSNSVLSLESVEKHQMDKISDMQTKSIEFNPNNLQTKNGSPSLPKTKDFISGAASMIKASSSSNGEGSNKSFQVDGNTKMGSSSLEARLVALEDTASRRDKMVKTRGKIDDDNRSTKSSRSRRRSSTKKKTERRSSKLDNEIRDFLLSTPAVEEAGGSSCSKTGRKPEPSLDSLLSSQPKQCVLSDVRSTRSSRSSVRRSRSSTSKKRRSSRSGAPPRSFSSPNKDNSFKKGSKELDIYLSSVSSEPRTPTDARSTMTGARRTSRFRDDKLDDNRDCQSVQASRSRRSRSRQSRSTSQERSRSSSVHDSKKSPCNERSSSASPGNRRRSRSSSVGRREKLRRNRISEDNRHHKAESSIEKEKEKEQSPHKWEMSTIVATTRQRSSRQGIADDTNHKSGRISINSFNDNDKTKDLEFFFDGEASFIRTLEFAKSYHEIEIENKESDIVDSSKPPTKNVVDGEFDLSNTFDPEASFARTLEFVEQLATEETSSNNCSGNLIPGSAKSLDFYLKDTIKHMEDPQSLLEDVTKPVSDPDIRSKSKAGRSKPRKSARCDQTLSPASPSSIDKQRRHRRSVSSVNDVETPTSSHQRPSSAAKISATTSITRGRTRRSRSSENSPTIGTIGQNSGPEDLKTPRRSQNRRTSHRMFSADAALATPTSTPSRRHRRTSTRSKSSETLPETPSLVLTPTVNDIEIVVDSSRSSSSGGRRKKRASSSSLPQPGLPLVQKDPFIPHARLSELEKINCGRKS